LDRSAALPANPFYASPERRIALARRQFFEDGIRPSGMVSEAVIQSWTRCLRAHADPSRAVEFEPVTPSRVHSALRSNRPLLEAAAAGMDRLRDTLAHTGSTAILTDAQGILVGSTFCRPRSHERLMPLAARVGVNLSEEAVGTTAPGITARTGEPSVVRGAEHFFGNVVTMHCAAAPIRDIRGRLAGVLDLSSEGQPFGFDAAAVVAHFAAEIENRLACAQSTEHLVLRLQIAPSMLDTPLAGLVGVTGDGRIDWLNGVAARLLGMSVPPAPDEPRSVEDRLGVTLQALLALSGSPDPQPLHLPGGLMLWLRCEWRSRDGQRRLIPAMPARDAVAEPPAAAPTASLRDTERAAVRRALAECGGNVSRAARLLGVSRGLIYRQLRKERG
jgi:transcriptional regulator of acetoin/glycerol metabolism